IYHPLAVATITAEEGIVIRRLVPGVSARDVAEVFRVRCYAGPDLAPWLPADDACAAQGGARQRMAAIELRALCSVSMGVTIRSIKTWTGGVSTPASTRRAWAHSMASSRVAWEAWGTTGFHNQWSAVTNARCMGDPSWTAEPTQSFLW